MTIQRGQPWGEPGSLPADGIVATSDGAARWVVERARRRGEDAPVLGLTGGDLCKTLGGIGRLETAFTVDVGAALVDGRLHWFVAHLAAHTAYWGRAVVAMNAQWLGRWNVAPKGHPNDGVLDFTEAALCLTDRFKVRSRLPSGTHLPHPGITVRRSAAQQFEFPRPVPVWLDGERVGTVRTLSVRVEPDALKVVV